MRLLCLYCVFTILSLAPALSITVTGSVLGTDGKPIAGADVVGIGYRQQVPASSDNTGAFSLTLDDVNDEDAAANARVGGVTIYAPGFAVTGGALYRQGNIFRLAPSGKVSGVVKDEQGHALAGVRVSLSTLQWMQGKTSSFCSIPSQLSHRFTVETDANGRWVIADVMLKGKARVTVRHPRYVTQGKDVSLGPDAAPAPALVLHPAALCSGCVTFEDGKPASAIHVTASVSVRDDRGHWATDEADTGADGRYTLDGLPGGPATIAFEDRSGQWVALKIDKVELTAGKTVAAPPATLTAGALIDGKISDADTGKPIVHAGMIYSGPQGESSFLTDNTGAYHLRVAPGTIRLELYLPKDYIQDLTEHVFDVQAGEHKRLDFTAKKGLTLSGTLVDEEGHPIHQVMGLDLYNIPDSDTPGGGYTESDAQGHFTFKGLSAGEKSARLEDNNYEFTDLVTVDVPSTGPVKLTVKLTPQKVVITHSVTARVLTTEGKPLPGVQVTVMINSEQRYSTVDSTSNPHGMLTCENVPSGGTLTVMTAVKPGYRFMAGGKSQPTAGEAALTDIIMAPCTSSVQGTVMDAAGKPVAGAKVMEALGDYTCITTDAHGQFRLTALPSGAVTLFAATDRAFGTATVHTGAAPVTLVLARTAPQAEQDLPRARTLLQRLFAEAKGGQYRSRFMIPYELAPYDVPAMMTMFTDDGGTFDTFQLYDILSQHIAGVPAATLDELIQRIDHIDKQPAQIVSCALLGYALYEHDPTRAQQLYAQAKEYRGDTVTSANEKEEEIINDVILDLFLAPLANKLKNGEEQGYLDHIVDVLKTPKVGEKIMEIIPDLVRISPVLAQRIIKAIPPDASNRLCMLSQIIPAVTVFDEKSTAQWLADAAADEKLAAQWLQETGEQNTNALPWFILVTASVFDQLGKTDAAGVAALARAVHDPQGRMVALAIAADSQPPAEALALLKEAAGLASDDKKSQLLLYRICAKISLLDPDAGRKLFTHLYEQLNSDQVVTDLLATLSYSSVADPDMPATLAFYGRMIDPAKCRLLLEAALQLPQRALPEFQSSTLPLILAMAPLDFSRAEALARALPAATPGNMRIEAERKLAQYLLTPAADRPNIAFNHWCERFQTGIPLGW